MSTRFTRKAYIIIQANEKLSKDELVKHGIPGCQAASVTFTVPLTPDGETITHFGCSWLGMTEDQFNEALKYPDFMVYDGEEYTWEKVLDDLSLMMLEPDGE